MSNWHYGLVDGFKKGVLWRYALTKCIFFPNIEKDVWRYHSWVGRSKTYRQYDVLRCHLAIDDFPYRKCILDKEAAHPKTIKDYNTRLFTASVSAAPIFVWIGWNFQQLVTSYILEIKLGAFLEHLDIGNFMPLLHKKLPQNSIQKW